MLANGTKLQKPMRCVCPLLAKADAERDWARRALERG